MSSTQYIDVQHNLEKLQKTVHPDNADAVRRFIDHQAAEGISDVQQDQQINSFRAILTQFAPEGFRLEDATEDELKTILANLNRSKYAGATVHKFKGAIKKFYKVDNGGRDHPDKVDFFTVTRKKETTVTREDIFTDDELKRLFQNFLNNRDKALAMVLYESAARPDELLSRNIQDFTTNGKGDFIFLVGSKFTPDRTNQLVRAGRTLREWLSQHPVGGELGAIEDPTAPLWVKSQQQACAHCGNLPRDHTDDCEYEPDVRDPLTYGAFYPRFKDACKRAGIPANKAKPYNLRHTRLTEVATFMGYEQLNKFAGWVPGSSRAKIYVHLNSDDVNRAIRDQYGLTGSEDENQRPICSFCGTENEHGHTECRTCGRPLSLEKQFEENSKLEILDRLVELDQEGVLDRLKAIEEATAEP